MRKQRLAAMYDSACVTIHGRRRFFLLSGQLQWSIENALPTSLKHNAYHWKDIFFIKIHPHFYVKYSDWIEIFFHIKLSMKDRVQLSQA